MPIPNLDKHGLLPPGVHDCTLEEIGRIFGGNVYRKELFQYFLDCLRVEIRPVFDDPIYINGSFVTYKEIPYDIDVVLDLRNTTDGRMLQGLVFMTRHQTRFLDEYRVHFWINLPGFEDFSTFFQYVGTKTARFKSLNPRHLKGILRIVR